MFSPFNTCWERVERAEVHRQSLTKLWNGLDTDKAYASQGNMRSDGTGEFFITPVDRDWLLPFSLQFGEMLYQLRGALDSCVYDAAVLKFSQNPPPDEQKWEFVFGSDAIKFNESVKRMKKLPDDVRGLIESVQPYTGMTGTDEDQGVQWHIGQTLGILNDWARIDRHRKLHMVGTAISGGHLSLGVPEGMFIEYCNFFTDRDILENKSKIAEFKIGNYVPHTKIHMQPRFTFAITVNETPRVALQDIAMAMGMSVSIVRELFERHFGISR
jgi:hypothetical protein